MWTPDKKVGDEVVVWPGGFSRERRVLRIARETATQFVLDDHGETRVRKSNGRVCGSRGWAEDYTDEVRSRIAQQRERERLDYEALRVLNAIEDMYYHGKGGNREWLVKHIGPLLPKEGE